MSEFDSSSEHRKVINSCFRASGNPRFRSVVDVSASILDSRARSPRFRDCRVGFCGEEGRGGDGFLLQGPAGGGRLHHLHGVGQAREWGAHQVWVPGRHLVIALADKLVRSTPCISVSLLIAVTCLLLVGEDNYRGFLSAQSLELLSKNWSCNLDLNFRSFWWWQCFVREIERDVSSPGGIAITCSPDLMSYLKKKIPHMLLYW